ncbi:PilN family type IVB pilus formation outer membrane protein [Pseudomonas sp. 5S4]|uniref:PilN family type IVB pilus formation outer membrane protein n=2 Tax=unclassified Pseudomonas TaxID=196821 RepID=UPI002AB39CFD|nr:MULTISPECIES: PilN family type IVB pilus formation outer membrane protein [unclassified Pseudomonas]MDY7563434.1 PilN family type IVB pilus formation outer membrane protein [Pseudomonas sp. AB6]MEB0198174.1 PilN family type IVB pilus formation outer membrane protein [Pseudomonas sp. 5S4]MEB0213414.1 PilN family type IVB pilus formation outer membrane protein [Pseudomonas sp. AB6]MEB0247837.1 PilN family type IVB pilus formation outer membrane protein [Pseudomonas sp. 10S5]
MMKSFFKLNCITIALLVCTSCTLQRVNESAARAEKEGADAAQYAANARNQRPEPKRATVIFSDKPWVSTQPVAAKRGLPTALDCEKTYRPTGSITITDVAQFITNECGVPVLVSPEAINPGLSVLASGGSQIAQGPALANPESLAGLFPSGPTQGPRQGVGIGTAGFAAPSVVNGIKFNGRISALLDLVTSRLGLSWYYSQAERAVRVNYFDTKVFDVYAFGDKQEIETVVKSGMTTTTGSGAGTNGGSSAASGASGESGSNQSTKVTLNTSILSDIQNNVQSMLSQSPPGRLYMAPSTGTLTVTDRPEVLARVEAYLNKTNAEITRQVLFNVKVFEVTLTDTDQLGLNWQAVYKSLSGNFGFSLTNTAAGISTNAVAGSIGIVDSANSPWAGSTAIIKALAEQGRVSDVRSPSVTTLNLQPAPIQIGNVKGYIPSSSTSSTASVGTSTALNAGTITSGFNMTLLPRIIANDDLLVMISINMSSKPTFTTFTSGGSSAQTADYDTKGLSPKVKLRSGQTLILSGFDEMSEDANKSGVGSPGFMGLGGSQVRTSTHSVLVVLITPILLGQAGDDEIFGRTA